MPGPRRNKTLKESKKVMKTKRSAVPAKTLESGESKLIHLATKEAERRIKNGTATSQMLIHYLRMGSVSETLSREKLRNENKLLKAKTDALASAKRIEELYAEALAAMREYSGKSKMDLDDEDDYDN